MSERRRSDRRGWSWLIVGGCPRSGTTLLNLLLNSHPEIRLTNENDFGTLLERLQALFYREDVADRAPRRAMGSNEKWSREDIRLATLRADKCLLPLLRTLYESGFADQVDLDRVRYFGDKLPAYYARDFANVRSVLSPLKIIHVSRNPLSVVNSMLWRTRNAALGKDLWSGWTTTEEGCAEWARAWNFVRGLQRSASPDLQVHHVKYEELVRDPETALQGLCEFLAVSDRFDSTRVVRDAESTLEMIDPAVEREIRRRLPEVVETWDAPLAEIESTVAELPEPADRRPERDPARGVLTALRRLALSRPFRPAGALVRGVLATTGYEIRRLPTSKTADTMSRAPDPTGKQIAGRDEIIAFFLQNYRFDSVLDVGCGHGTAFAAFANAGRKATGIDLLPPDRVTLPSSRHGAEYIRGDAMQYETARRYDAVFCSHVVEHMADTERFLRKLFSFLDPEGAFCIIWPPPKPNVVGGHVHVFNMGMMLYNLVRIGIDCREVDMARCQYSLGVMGRLRRFEVPPLVHDEGDIEMLSPYFPFPARQDFDGNDVPGVRDL